MKIETVRKLAAVFVEAGLTELKYSAEDGSLELKKEGVPQAQKAGPERKPAAPAAPPAEKRGSSTDHTEEGGATPPDDRVIVEAPLAGVFYHAPEPGGKPFAAQGSRVKRGDPIGLIEAMKVMSEIPSPCDGTVEEVLLADGTFAEYRAKLMRIRKE